MDSGKRFVYVLKSRAGSRYYIGVTADLSSRTDTHNAGGCPHTVKHRPWQRHVVIEFQDERRAMRFERSLKSGSGRAFAKRHFEPA